jgi:hypothetical protein
MSEIISSGGKQFLRLPAVGEKCPISAFSRSYFYKLEKSGELALLHVKQAGKTRGVTLIPVAEFYAFLKRRGTRKEVA